MVFIINPFVFAFWLLFKRFGNLNNCVGFLFFYRKGSFLTLTFSDALLAARYVIVCEFIFFCFLKS